jgi:hypothetical protein
MKVQALLGSEASRVDQVAGEREKRSSKTEDTR